MKSAYELAMERLKAADGEATPELSQAQKQQLADINQRYKAKLAEREIFLNQQIAAARAAGNAEEFEKLNVQLRRERTSIEEDREDEKNKVRRAK